MLQCCACGRINDSLGAAPGEGALVTNETFDASGTGGLSQTYAVWIDPGVDRAGWSPDLSFALLQALEKEPERRPPTATAYTTMLQVAAAGAKGLS